MHDSIYIADLEFRTHIGVPDKERQQEQTLFVSVELFTNTRQAAETDSIEHTIDYAAVVQAIQALAATERQTVERLAEDIASAVLAQFAPSGGVKVRIRKDILPQTKGVFITITRPWHK